MKKHRPGRVILRILGALLALGLLALAVLFAIPLTERGDRRAVNGSADWMAGLDDALPLNQIVLPGSHDSATQYVQLAFVTRCQALSIAEQLNAGCRYLDIRLGMDAHKGTFKLMHGFTSCKPSAFSFDALYLEDMLRACYAFLAEHPTETVVFAVKQEHGDESVIEFETALDAYLGEHPDFWLLTDTIPTLGEARGKLVLMRRYEDAAGLGARAGIPLLWPDQKGHDNTALNTEASSQGSYTLWVQDRFEFETEDKWTAFQDGLAAAEEQAGAGDLAIHFLSTKGAAAYGHPWHFAKTLNTRLMSESALSGWIVLDFFSAPLAEHIYSANF